MKCPGIDARWMYMDISRNKMIYMVTLNPSLDYIVSVRDFKQGFANRTDSELILPGGKGINVFVVLKNLGMESTALSFTAGFTGEEISERFAATENDYVAARAADVRDVSERIVRILQEAGEGASALENSGDEWPESSEPVIVVAEDLSPSETVQMNKDKVLAFVTVHGSADSHTAILAGMMGIPALVRTVLILDASMDVRRKPELKKKEQLRELRIEE